MTYRVIITSNGKYKMTLHRSKTRETAFINYHKLIDENQQVMFPKKYTNTKKIKPVEYKICVVKPTEEGDVFRTIRDDFGRTYIEKPIGEWTILDSHSYQFEEKFWVFGMNPKANRPTIREIVKRLMTGAHKKNMTKQIIVVYNKLLIYNEDQFDMVICKCKSDAQRLHHTLAKIAKKQKIKSLLFMGTATPATTSRLYDLIQENTGWSYTKIWRTTTRP
jgi:hypothetical protein